MELTPEEKELLVQWLLKFFEGWVPFFYRIFKEQEEKLLSLEPNDVGSMFLAFMALGPDDIKLVALLPDVPFYYELAFHLIHLKKGMKKNDIITSLCIYVKNLVKYSAIKNFSETTFKTIAENTHDEDEYWAVYQNPEGMVDLFVDYIRTIRLGTEPEQFEPLRTEMKNTIPEFLKK